MLSTKKSMLVGKMGWPVGLAGAVACVGVIAAGYGQTRANTYLSENFNHGGTSLGTFTAPNGGVTDNGTESAFTNTAGGDSALLTSSPGFTVLDSPSFAVPTSDPVQISFDFDIITANASNNDTFVLNSARNIILNFGGPAAASSSVPGKMVYKNGSSGVATNFAPSLNTWYHITLGLSAEDAANPNWSINVTNTAGQSQYSASDILFSNALAQYTSMNYSFNVPTVVDGASFQVDNVLVATPEPTVISLLGLGALGLLIVNPRRRART